MWVLISSGLKTATLNVIHNEVQKRNVTSGGDLPGALRAEIAAAFTRAVVDGITSKLDLALSRTGAKQVVLAGGVAANSHLRAAAEAVSRRHDAALFLPPLSLCGDNAVMVGAQAYFDFCRGLTAPLDLNAFASDEGADDAERQLFQVSKAPTLR